MSSPTEPNSPNPVSEKSEMLTEGSETFAGVPEKGSSETGFGPPLAQGEVGVLGPYRIVKELGHGGMGAVYAAMDTRLDRALALKVMLPHHAASKDSRERFLREAKAAAKIKHDNVVTVYEADERDGIPYIAMEFLEGYPLDAYLKKKGSPGMSQIIRIGKETAEGLAAAHKLGLVHRDIKPGNLWLEAPNGRVKVLDFGLAKPLDSEVEMTKSGMIVGTPAYMSPEQARSQKLDPRSDLFSLGALLYRLCTGLLPFQGENTMAILMALGSDEPKPVLDLNPNVPEALAILIHQLLAKNPNARPQNAGEVAERLRRIGTGQTLPSDNVVAQPVVYTPIAITAETNNPFADIDADVSRTEMVSGSSNEVATPKKPARKKSGAGLLWGVAAGLFVMLGLVIGIILFLSKGKDRTEAKNDTPDNITDGKDKEKKNPKVEPPKIAPPAGKFALEFSKGQYAIASKVPQPATADVTIEAWVRLKPSTTEGHKEIVAFPNGSLNVGRDASGTGLELYTFHNHVTAKKAFTPGELIHIAGTNDGKQRRLYVNGKLVAKQDDPNHPSPEQLKKGFEGKLSIGTLDFEGIIEQVRISTKPIYNQDFTPPALFTKEKDTYALYLFEEGQGDTLKDSSGNNYHAKINGAKWIKLVDSDQSPDRKAAEFVIKNGGGIWINDQHDLLGRNFLKEVPKGDFRLTGVRIEGRKDLKAEDFRVFAECKHLNTAFLSSTPVGDEGVAHLQNCPALRRLELFEMDITDKALALFGKKKDWLELTICELKCTPEGFAAFAGQTELERLFLWGENITDRSLAGFVGCTKLRNVLIRGGKLTDTGVMFLKDSPNIEDIDLKGLSTLNDQTMKHILGLKWLNKLVIGSIPKSQMTIKSLEGAPVGPHLIALNLHKMKGESVDAILSVCGKSRLISLDVSESGVTPQGLAQLQGVGRLAELLIPTTGIGPESVAFLSKCTGLLRLDIQKTKLTEADAKELAKALPHCRIFHDSGTYEPYYTPEDLKAIEMTLKHGGTVSLLGQSVNVAKLDALPKIASPTALIFSQSKTLTDADLVLVSKTKNVRSIVLEGTTISDKGLEHLKGMPTLRHISLYGCKNITDNGVAALRECRQLDRISLSETPITDAAFEGAFSWPDLYHLDVKTTQFSDVGLAHLAKNHLLNRLEVDATKITDKGLDALAGNRNLQALTLDQTEISDAGLAKLMGCTGLLSLRVGQTKITPKGVWEFSAKAPNCTITTDAGVIKPYAEPDRSAAVWAIAKGGAVRLNRQPQEYKDVNFPKDRFSVTSVNLSGLIVSDDDLITLERCTSLESINLTKTKVTEKRAKELSETLPKCKIEYEGGVVGPIDFDRTAAEWALSVMGAVAISPQGNIVTVQADLPKEPFQIATLNLNNKAISNEDLARFKNCQGITGLLLGGTGIGDIGLANFQKCKGLTTVAIGITNVTNEGLMYLKDWKNLSQLDLSSTAISDEGLVHLKELKNLTTLDLKKTRVSAKGATDLHKSIPQCKIEYEGGVLESKVVVTPDRKATDWAWSVGGQISIKIGNNVFQPQKLADLPNEPFALMDIRVNGKPQVTDAGLENLKGLKGLEQLYLYQTDISDAGLAHLKNLQSLKLLSLSTTKVTNEGLSHIKELPSLTSLHLDGLKIGSAGLAHVKELKNLTELKLYNTPVADTDLVHLKELKKLEILNLSTTQVTDTGLTHLQELKNLKELNLTKTKVTAKGAADLQKELPACKIEYEGGVLEPKKVVDTERLLAEWVLSAPKGVVQINDDPREVSRLEDLPKPSFRLSGVNLGGKKLSDEVLVQFKGCKHLKLLALNDNPITNVGLANFAQCKDLKRIYLGQTKVTDGGLAQFKDCKDLIVLHIGFTKVTDKGMANFKECTGLTELILSSTEVTDTGLANFKGSKNLTQLWLDDLAITDDGVANFKDCTNLTALYLQNTKLTDTGLAHFMKCTKLTTLSVKNTKVTLKKLQEFQTAVPNCRIEYDGGFLEPKK